MTENNLKKIKILKDGPYVVTGNIPLSEVEMVIGKDGEPESWKKVKDYPIKQTYSLCRCGNSKTMPFCDGSHTECKFHGTETAKRKNFSELAEKTVGPGLDLLDAECFCAIAMFCHRAGDTWTLTEKSDDPNNKRIAIEEACDCPSGRLVAVDKETGKPIEPNFEPSISIIRDTRHNVSGPIWVKGYIQVESSDGYQYEKRNRVTLCRCGMSNGKPFCDGKHVTEKFKQFS